MAKEVTLLTSHHGSIVQRGRKLYFMTTVFSARAMTLPRRYRPIPKPLSPEEFKNAIDWRNCTKHNKRYCTARYCNR